MRPPRRARTWLLQQLDIDDGARFLGEFAFGTNFDIAKFTKQILFDEKIGGTVHPGSRRSLRGSRRKPTPPLSTGTWSATCATAGASKSTGSPSWSTASFSAGRMMTLIHLSLPPQSQLSFRPKWRNLLPRQPNPQRRYQHALR